MDAAVDIGRNPVSTIFSVSIENEQAGTRQDSQTCLAKPNSQARTGSRKFFPVQLTMNRIGSFTRLPWGCCGHASGIYFPRPLWFDGCATLATLCSVPGYSYFRMCLEKSERNCLTSYLYNPREFFFIRVFKGVLSSELVNQEQKKRTVTSKKHASRPASLLLCLLQPQGGGKHDSSPIPVFFFLYLKMTVTSKK